MLLIRSFAFYELIGYFNSLCSIIDVKFVSFLIMEKKEEYIIRIKYGK